MTDEVGKPCALDAYVVTTLIVFVAESGKARDFAAALPNSERLE